MLVGGTMVNALAFSGSNYLFSMLRSSDLNEERKRHDQAVERYARYEARLGAAMTKTLGSAALQLYAGVVYMFLPIPAENQPGLIADLEGDPFFRARSKQCHLQGIP